MKVQTPNGEVELERTADGATIDGEQVDFEVAVGARGEWLVTFPDGRVARIWAHGDQVHAAGRVWKLPAVETRRGRAGGESGDLTAPMPGVVLAVRVAAGDSVEEGQVLMVLEAMKMEQPVKAPRAGRVARVCFAEGDRVGPGDTLLLLEEVLVPAEGAAEQSDA